MKNLGTIFATLAVTLALLVPPAGAHSNDEHPSDTVCLTYPAAVIGCATGTIGHVGPTGCNANGCTVTITADLSVTPVACGWLEQGDLRACAIEKPEPAHRDTPNFYAPGSYTVRSDLCVSDPTVTVTVPCTELVHHFIVPATTSGAQMNVPYLRALVGALIPGDEPVPDVGGSCGEGSLVYASATFRVYAMDAIC